jgi:hypothetical protein
VEVAPADEPHGERHSKLNALLEACTSAEYNAACDMLTRTSKISDIAPDASVYPMARDPKTGGRQLEELAFEIVSTQTLSDAADKARRLSERGVRRVFALDIPHQRVFEWSREAATWRVLPDAGAIEDPALVARLPVEALIKAAKADDAMAQALLAKRNRVLVTALEREHRDGHDEGRRAGLEEGRQEGQREGRQEGLAEGKLRGMRSSLLAIAEARRVRLDEAQRDRIAACDDPRTLGDWTRRAAKADEAADIFE